MTNKTNPAYERFTQQLNRGQYRESFETFRQAPILPLSFEQYIELRRNLGDTVGETFDRLFWHGP